MLEKFATDQRTYRSTTDQSGAISDVVRLSADDMHPLRYRKVVKGRQSSLVKNEQNILNYCALEGLDKVVQMLDYKMHLDKRKQNNSQEITTQSAGVDLDKGSWLDTSIYLPEYDTQHRDIFHHPLLHLTVLKHSLQALHQIHTHGIIHCDIKLDNICLPFSGVNADKGTTIRPLFEQITLIDFGHSHWKGNSIGNSTRIWLGICQPDYRYQSQHLINILTQWNHDNANSKRQYNHQSLEQINYSCDLYSLGFAFNYLSSCIKGNLQTPPWSLVWADYQQVIQQLLSYDNGLTDNAHANAHTDTTSDNLPHPAIIQQIDGLIARLERHFGYKAEGIQLQLRESYIIERTHTPTVPYTPTPLVILEEDSTSSDEQAWELACQVDSLQGYQAYLRAFPEGMFAEEAVKHIKNAQQAVKKTVATPHADNLSITPSTTDLDLEKLRLKRLKVIKQSPQPSELPTEVDRPVLNNNLRKWMIPLLVVGLLVVGFVGWRQFGGESNAIVTIPYSGDIFDGEDLELYAINGGFFSDVLYGLTDKQGNIILEPKYDDIGRFHEGLIRVGNKKWGGVEYKYGFINKQGKEVISLQYEDAYSFSEGLAVVKKDGKYGFINKQGKEVIALQYADADSFDDGLAKVEKDHKYGFINQQGDEVIALQYDTIGWFTEGLAVVKKDGKYGFINQQGEEVIALQYDEYDEYDDVYSFSEGLAVVKKDGKWGFINKKGEEIIALQYDDVYSFYEGLAVVKKDDKYGFINKQGEEIIPLQYDNAYPFAEGLARVKKDDKWGIINKQGEEIIPLQYDNAYSFAEGLAVVRKDGKYGFINKQGEEIIPLQYDNAYSFAEGLARVKKDDKWGFINTQGEVVIVLQYDYAGSFSGGLTRVEKEGKYGFINQQGEVVIALQYDDAFSFSNGLAWVKTDGKSFYINKRGEWVKDAD